MIQLAFEKSGGLLPAIAQDHEDGTVLMVAYMNEQAWKLTLETRIAHYWSRSRGKIWKKGESSGNIQEVKEIRVDCDGDCILIKVKQLGGAACHTGYRSCFHHVLGRDGFVVDGVKVFDPEAVYGKKE